MKGFSTLDNPSHQGKTNTWLTPMWLIDELGPFDLDPCGFPGHHTAERLITLPKDGLTQPWHGRIWLNPPYGRETGTWLNKLQEHGNGIALVFARTDTTWFQGIKPEMTFFMRGRLAFLDENKNESTNAGHGSVLLAFGRQNAGDILKSNLEGVWHK